MRTIPRQVIVIAVSALLIAVLGWLTRIVEMPLRRTTPADTASDQSIVLRTHFADELAWRSIVAAIEAPAGEFRARVRFVNDPAHLDMTVDQAVAFARRAEQTFIFLVDGKTIEGPERPILVIDAHDRPGRAFRVIPAAMWSVENNLSLANMDFEEFADAVGADGVFRGFARR